MLRVLNVGIQGWNLLRSKNGSLVPAELTDFLIESGSMLKPDIVVYAICLNDIPSVVKDAFSHDNALNRSKFAFFPERFREWFKRKAIYRFLRDVYRESRFRELNFSELPAPSNSREYWAEVSTELARMKNVVERMEARLYAVIIPYSFQILPQHEKMLAINERWKEVLMRNGIPHTDISQYLNEDNVLGYYALGDYIHLNNKGHALVADSAFSLIRDQLQQKHLLGRGD